MALTNPNIDFSTIDFDDLKADFEQAFRAAGKATKT